MKKLLHFVSENILFLLTLFFLIFIPLYPKIPLLDIKHTWVYIRVEDFLVALAWAAFFIQLARKKATLKTPLSVPIVVFWLIGGIATLHAVLFIFPHLSGVFPNLAFLNWLRRVEYLSLFFLAFSGMRKKNFVTPVVVTIALTMIAVFLYGLGQRFLGFPAFMTMNEEFAKGIPLRLSPNDRIPSTFAGHYDLAAYLTFLIPVMGSMIFAYKKWYAKIFFFLTGVASLILLLMTASRTSYAMYILSITLMLILQKQKKWIIPVIILSIVLMESFQGISQRFAGTFQQVNLVVDSRTGKAIGVASQVDNNNIVIEDKQSTGENLPQGSSYINIPNSTGKQVQSQITYKKLQTGSNQPEIISKTGTVIVKKAFAYDVSFTTRFQGEWPRALNAFKRNILFGSGYSSISLATDNDYLRMLGETGLLGFFSFLGIFLITTIYILQIVPDVPDRRTRSLAYGFLAGLLGLSLNAVLIDVFTASKVAFVLWSVVGVVLGSLKLYQTKPVHVLAQLRRVLLSPVAIMLYLFVGGLLIFASGLNNYFVGDDFTWLRWAADCKLLTGSSSHCLSPVATILRYFTDSAGFFYRPGTKAYFYLMYPFFELFPAPYHLVSLLLHITASILVFFIGRKLLKSNAFGFVAAFLFLVLSTHGEAIYWASVTGHLVASCLLLFALLCYMYWRDGKHWILAVFAWLAILVATFFHEFGIVGPLLLIAYDIYQDPRALIKKWQQKWYYLVFFIPDVIYAIMRISAHSVMFQGDYSYNLAKLPFNVVGNTVGYLMLSLIGPQSLSWYESLRTSLAHNLIFASGLGLLLLAVIVGLIVALRRVASKKTLAMVLFVVAFFIIALLPFLGLGNITTRYAYLPSVGVVFLLAYLLQRFVGRVPGNVWVKTAIVVVLVGFFGYFQLQTLEKVDSDWQHAGEITNSTVVSINYAYVQQESNLPKNPVFTFVNVPIKYGEAWVFPVGLPDALWFSFQNVPLQVKETTSEQDAINQAKKSHNIHVFKYMPDGSLAEVNIPTPTPTQPVSKKTVSPTNHAR